MASAVNAVAAASSAASLAVSAGVSGRGGVSATALPLRRLEARSAFTGRSLLPHVAPAASRNQRKAPSKFGVRAYEWHEYDPNEELAELDIREWPYKKFVEETLEAFPEKMIADVEEARVLYESGYTYVDVRPALELQEVGKVVNSVNVPLYNAKRVYSKAEHKKVVQKEENKDFMKQFEKKFPNKSAKLVIACSDGQTYSMPALEMLDEAGYTNLVALKGGYYAWFRVFDNKLNRRRSGDYAEDFRHDAGSAGIHASGAGFEKMDAIEQWVPPSY
ncbi:hypothetical protein KFL_007570020 [Klebsormidium nitens]|uniref:Rhodanese domain-containing protein n=1 Tax=Klebsormidium nitens TaxID=105231 RepID=A0A1Y1IP59_KLENI|nr:hypothetical protein KFL_007570020 [Klebsormidium nitens]|eukprot:GAQ91279.1 hypothetical protein KFL_007570020 [Klebsormidium nitens]